MPSAQPPPPHSTGIGPDRHEPAVGGVRFEIQARLMRRRGDVVVRDDVRHGSAGDADAARHIARRFAADGFTTWIYRLEKGSGTGPVYRRIDVLYPSG